MITGSAGSSNSSMGCNAQIGAYEEPNDEDDDDDYSGFENFVGP